MADLRTRKMPTSAPHNLPLERDPLIGREREVVMVQRLLRDDAVGLVTLTGPGGTGKTRLALQVAAEVLDLFRDGVYFVPLAPVSLPNLVVPTIARTLGLAEVGDRPLLENLQEYLRRKRLLLLLDNFEQVLGRVRPHPGRTSLIPHRLVSR